MKLFSEETLAHTGTKNMRWGYSKGKLVDPDKVAKDQKILEPKLDIKSNEQAIDSARDAFYDALDKYNSMDKSYTDFIYGLPDHSRESLRKRGFYEMKDTANAREEVERLGRLYESLKNNREHNKTTELAKEKIRQGKSKINKMFNSGTNYFIKLY